jgi:hypothetical protein
MAEKIVNYEDNIFYLILKLKVIRDGLKLEIDSRFFGQSIVQDVFHMIGVLDEIFKPLRTNPHLLKRHIYLKEIRRLKKQFIDFIDDIVENKVPQAAIFSYSIEKLKEVRKNYAKDLLDIKVMLPKASGENPEEEHMVSEEEFRFLLLPDEENP